MITTRWRPKTRSYLLAALILSVLIHLFGGALWERASVVLARVMHRTPTQQPREDLVATSDVIRLEKRTIPRPARASRPRPQPQPQPPHPQPQPPHPVAVVRPRVVPVPAPVASPVQKVAKPQATARPEVAHLVVHAPKQLAKAESKPPGGGALSPQQVAQLTERFSKTIAQSRTDLATIQKETQEQPATIKRYPMQFTGVQSALHRGEGYIHPLGPGQRIGTTIWYYTHYTYMWADGHIEDDDIPWPFHYPVDRDLFAMGVRLIPVQPPPPGYRLKRALKPFLQQFVAGSGAPN